MPVKVFQNSLGQLLQLYGFSDTTCNLAQLYGKDVIAAREL